MKHRRVLLHERRQRRFPSSMYHPHIVCAWVVYRPELVTPPLTRGDILPGVTRSSILDLSRSWGGFDVSERHISMKEIKEAADDNRLLEAFGAGTAAVVTPVSCIQYKGEDIEIPAVGELTKRVWDELTGIQYRKKEGPPGWIVEL
jgi:branched-chain amino acid aminotransferase